MVALGDCALGSNVLGLPDEIVGPVDAVLPVAAQIPGCPPSPDSIAAALLELIDTPRPLERQAGAGSKRSFSTFGGTLVG